MHWAKLREGTNQFGMRILLTVYRLFGRVPFRVCLYPVLVWYLWRRDVARQASREYLARLHAASQGQTPAPSLWQVLRHFAAFAEVMLDRFAYNSSDSAREAPSVLTGEEHVFRILESGRGAVLLTAHMGNLELCRLLARARGDIRVNVLVHLENARQFNEMLHANSPESALNLIPVTEISAATAAMLAERIEHGEFVVITGDRIPVINEKDILTLDFLGSPARFPLGPYVLASLFRCPLLALFCTLRQGVYHVGVTPIADQVVLPRRDRYAGAQPIAQRYIALLEAECRAAPLQWFNFFPFWGDTPVHKKS